MTNPILGNVGKETTTTQGVVTYSLDGAASSQFVTLVSAVGTGSEVCYKVYDDNDYEIGVGTVTDATPDTLTRDLILESSNAGAKVNWSTGTRTVVLGVPAEIINQTFRSITHNVATDANYTLTTSEYFCRSLEITDTGVVLTTGRDIVFPSWEFVWLVANNTAQTLTLKLSGQTGYALAAGTSAFVRNDGTDIVNILGDIATKTGTETLTNKTMGAFTLSGTVTGSNHLIDRVAYRDSRERQQTISSGGGAKTIDLTLGNVVKTTISTATTTFTFTATSVVGDQMIGFLLYITDGGSQTVNWPAAVAWKDGTAPTLTTTGLDVLAFFTNDYPTTWYGMPIALDI